MTHLIKNSTISLVAALGLTLFVSLESVVAQHAFAPTQTVQSKVVPNQARSSQSSSAYSNESLRRRANDQNVVPSNYEQTSRQPSSNSQQSYDQQSRMKVISPISAADPRQQAFLDLARDVEALDAQLGIIKRVVKLVTPSVVHIEARPLQQYRSYNGSQEAGSGILIRIGSTNCILTNRHVIRYSAATHVRVHLADGRELKPAKIWSDRQTDVAVMSLDNSVAKITPARVGDSSRLEIGEQVLAFGSPFGLSQSVTRGILSAKGRYNLDLGDGDVEYQNFLQTDAAINPGNSGGPLINLRGEVIGLNTAIASSSGGNEGIGFSIPINLAVRIAKQLVTEGTPSRGFLGVSLLDGFDVKRARTAGLKRPTGALVTRIEDGSPAQRAALKPDDVILAYDGIRVEDDEHLINLVNLTESGKRIEIELVREGVLVRTTAQIGRKSKP